MVDKLAPIFLAILVCLSRSSLAAAGPSEDDKYTFNLNVDMMRLSVTALDGHGSFVTDLEEHDFTVYEDGVKQEIDVFTREEVPLRMVVLLDVSSSMHPKMAIGQEAAIRFVHSLGPSDSVKVVELSHRVRTLIDFTSDFERVANAVQQTEASGETALYNALYVSLQELPPSGGQTQHQVMVVLSDGDDNRSLVPMEEVLELARRSDLTIYGVSILGASDDPNSETASEARYSLRKLSTESGGSVFDAIRVDDLQNVYRRITDELKSQYLLGYVSSVDAGNEWRRVQVVSGRSGVRVRARTGYYAANKRASTP